MVPRLVGLAVGLVFTWMVFFGAGYFGAVWTHYFADEPPKSSGEVSVKIINQPGSGMPATVPSCTKEHPCPAPHD